MSLKDWLLGDEPEPEYRPTGRIINGLYVEVVPRFPTYPNRWKAAADEPAPDQRPEWVQRRMGKR